MTVHRKLWIVPLVVLGVMLLCIEVVNGQDKPGKLAVVLGGSNFGGAGTGSVGGLWQITSRIAIRPEFTINHVDSRSPGRNQPHMTTTSTGYGISGPITIHNNDSLRLYISPRFAYSRSDSTTTLITNAGVENSTSSVTSGPYSGRVSFGGQYALNRHFSVFGETGVENLRMPIAQTLFSSSTKQSTWQVVTAFGLLLYFK
jgi:hypothetical protein